jgi:RHS repeat-associated protein
VDGADRRGGGDLEGAGVRSAGRTGTLQVDSLGNVVRATFGATDGWTYDAEGVLVGEAPAGALPVTYAFHPLSRRVRERVQGSETTSFTGFDGFGRLTAMTDPAGLAHAFTYDAMGLTSFEQHGAESVTSTFDGGGFLLTRQRNGGPTYTYAHGPRGELQQVVTPSGTYAVAHDAAAMRTGITFPDGPMPDLVFAYDYLGREKTRTRGNSSWQTSWSGAVATTTTTTGDVITRVVDGRGRTVKTSATPGSTSVAGRVVRMGFDGLDRPLFGEDAAGTSLYRYDDSGRALGVQRSGADVTYGLDSYGRVNAVASPGGTVEYGYDEFGRISSVGSDGRTTTVRWAHGGGRLEALEDGTLHEKRCYAGGRLTQVISGPPGTDCGPTAGPGVMSYEYGYDAAGLRETETYQGGGTATVRRFHYDADERLTGVNEETTGGSTTYTLAADGTRMGEVVRGTGGLLLDQRRYEHDGRGGLSRIVDELAGQTLATYTTDASGRVQEIGRPLDHVTRKLEWDAADRLLAVKDRALDPLGAVVSETVRGTYAYDYAGRRIAGTGAGGAATWIWDGGGLVEERLPGQPAALYEPVGGTVAAVGGVRALHDGLESIVGFAGGPRYRHDAWGQYVGSAPGAGIAGVGYAGQRWDADVGLSYAQQRWYEPGTGRFLSEDPVFGDLQTPASLHVFGYGNGNPLMFTDPRGEAGVPSGPTMPKGAFDFSAGPKLGEQCREKLKWAMEDAAASGERTAKEYGWFAGAVVDDAKTLWARFGAIPCAPFMVPDAVAGLMQIGPRAEAADAKMQNAPALSPAWWIAFGEKSQATVDAVSVAYGLKSLTAGPPMSTPAPVLAGVEGGAGALALPGELAGLGSPRALTPFVFLNDSKGDARGGGDKKRGGQEEGWKPGPNDLDWRGSGKGVKEAIEEAFSRTGVERERFKVTKCGKDANGKSFPVEWQAEGAEVSIDIPHGNPNAPQMPHVGYQTPGKRGAGGGVRGHILLDEVPVNR